MAQLPAAHVFYFIRNWLVRNSTGWSNVSETPMLCITCSKKLFDNQIKENCEKIVLDFSFLSNIHNNPMF